MRYFLGIGSNIDPYRNMPLILTALSTIGLRIWVGRVVETDPVGVEGGQFLNTVVGLETELSAKEVKNFCNKIETDLGRQRNDPKSKYKSRPAALDILLKLENHVRFVPADSVPEEKYLRPVMVEILDTMGVECPVRISSFPKGIALSLFGKIFGEVPAIFGEESTLNSSDDSKSPDSRRGDVREKGE